VPKDDDDEGGDNVGAGQNPQQFLLSFTHTFAYASTETSFFAFTYPYSY
jgi:hypothetical protein